MANSRFRTLVAVCTTMVFLLCSSHALAGIIVTEGKISRCLLTLEKAQVLWSLGIWPDEDAGCEPPEEAAEEGGTEEDSGHDYDEDEELDLEEEELGDLDSPPDGYTCSDLGNGIELCEEDEGDDEEEEEGQGAGAGSAHGGSWLGASASNESDTGHAEDSVGGCQAGSQSGDSLTLTLAVLFGLAVTRRRRQDVYAI